ncbi:MAG: hypothetical protein JRJ59_09680 [Deltaproteobacteria bacterium]|nr:hypothetical protein [Deltaproteobacteria bacterium]
MAQQIINYDEEMVGANHPTKSDTLNRGFLVSHADNGGLRSGTSFPTSGLEDRMMFYRTDENKIYVYDLAATTWRTSGSQTATGTYTGDGNTTQAITGLGFQPKSLIVYLKVGNFPVFIKTDQDSARTQVLRDGTQNFAWDLNTIISLDADGFTVGNQNFINNAAVSYTYSAWAD